MAESRLFPIWTTWVQFFVGLLAFIGFWLIFDDKLWDWKWSNVGTRVVTWLDFGYTLFPFGTILFISALSRLVTFQPNSYPPILTIIFTSICTILSCFVGFYIFFIWDGVALITMDESANHPARIQQSIALFLILMCLFVSLTLILARQILFYNINTSRPYIVLSTGNSEIDQSVTNEATGLLELQGAGGTKDTNKDGGGRNSNSVNGGGGGDGNDTETDTESKNDDNNNNVEININQKGYGSVITPSRAAIDKVYRQFDVSVEYTAVLGFFIVVMVGLLFINGVLPSDWDNLWPDEIESYNLNKCGQDWCFSISYKWRGDTYYIKIFGDLIIYFGFISCVSIISWMAMKRVRFRMMLRQRIFIAPIKVSFTIGQLIFWFLWFWLMFVSIYYWLHVHLYQGDNGKSTLEIWARFLGILSIIFLTFMFFTVTRIRLWYDCFGLSSDHLIQLHQIFGYCMISCGYAHMIFWIAYFISDNSSYDLKDNFIFVSSIPFSYNSDNWTVPVMQVLMIFYVPVAYFVFSSPYIRHKFFEWFYIIHLYSAMLMTVILLWHASQGWRYLVPCLMLYTIDRYIRFYNSSSLVRVDTLQTTTMGKDNNEYIVTRIGISVGQIDPSKQSGQDTKSPRAFYGNLRHKMGQYCYINIPAISPIEWHPFTVSSGPYERLTTFHIKSEGKDEFTGRLSALCKDYGDNQSQQPLKNLEFRIDGPYGIPFNYEGYHSIALIAGGIGITPCHSILSGMITIAKAQYQSIHNLTGLPFIHLIWLSRNPEMFDLFSETFKAAKLFNQECGVDLFNIKLYHTRPSDQESGLAERIRKKTNIRYNVGKINTDVCVRCLDDKDIDNNEKLVFCCGPYIMTKECKVSATKIGAHYYSESFRFNKDNDIIVAIITFVLLFLSIVIMGEICKRY